MRRLLLGSAILAAATLVACSKSDQDQTQRTIERGAGDAWVCTQVRASATALDPATVSLVKIECSPGLVTLRGEVRSAQERDQLIAATRKIDGVKAVDAHIVVNPKAPTGNEIADDVTLATKVHVAIAGQTGVNALKIGVGVHNGVATLTGDVPSPAIQTVAVDAARGVKGVKGVVDKLEVRR
ncbi:MAG TPA: BON domain-containing protein [Candidatus Eremiobacteraceae bacterium]|nr:BON domain-containing protein [Candidatus Eremiobacteraceae bacterium]